MDQNNQNNQPTQSTPPQLVTPPASEQQAHEAITTVQQPPDAQAQSFPMPGATEPQATPAPAEIKSEEKAPEQPAANVTPQAPATPMAAASQPHKKPLMLILGIVVIVMALAGGAVYFLGQMQKTERLGAYMKKDTPINVQPTPTLMPEEQEVNAIDMGSVDSEMQDIDKQLNSLQ